MKNRVCELLGIEHPIIQGGMVWCSGWKLAAAVSKAGGLGVLGAGSMYPDVLRHHIESCKEALKQEDGSILPFAVNLPLLYPDLDEVIEIVIEEKVPVVITSAGSPKRWTSHFQSHGIKVIHVVSSTYFALRCEEAGVDAIVAEGFEAGGHVGREETTTFVLIPEVTEAVSIPVIAAGGVASRSSYRAAFVLGADGVQIGTRFALCSESSAHDNYKEYCRGLGEGKTKTLLKGLAPVRMAINKFSDEIEQLEKGGADVEEVRELLGRGRSKKGIFEGDMEEGELSIGQVVSMVKSEESAAQIIADLING